MDIETALQRESQNLKTQIQRITSLMNVIDQRMVELQTRAIARKKDKKIKPRGSGRRTH